MLKEIASGIKPTTVFKEMLAAKPELTSSDIAVQFMEEFSRVSSEVVHIFWQWRKPGRDRGLDDGRVDEILAHYLKDAGYL